MSNPRARWIAWTGGYDSTALLLSALRAGDAVTPIRVMLSPPGSVKAIGEARSMRRVLRHCRTANIGQLLYRGVFFEQQPFWPVFDRIKVEFETALPDGYSQQVPMLVAMGERVRDIELAYVDGDGALQCPYTLARLRAVFDLPLRTTTKTELWERSHHDDRAVLAATWSCDDGAIVMGLPVACGACGPCSLRLPWMQRPKAVAS